METIKLRIDLDPNNAKTMRALAAFALTLAGEESVIEHVETPKAETEKVTAYIPKDLGKAETLKAETLKAETPKAETLKAETPKAETPKAETPKAEEGTTSIVEIRKQVLAKSQQFKKEIKAKLTDLGAANVMKLKPEQYEEFSNFLTDL